MANVTAIYFSPTGNSEKSVMAIANAISDDVKVVDLAASAEAPQIQFGADDLVIIGGPVYGGRIVKAAMARMNGLKGNGTPCIIVASYGNRHYDDALVEMQDVFTEAGFIIAGAAAPIGRHTFGEIQVDRPNADDLAETAEFANKVMEKIASGADIAAFEIPGNRPYKDGGNGGKFRPLTSDDCVNCGLCKKKCPMAAIAEDNKTINDDLCISCFRCIRKCPVKAKNLDTPAYNSFAEGFTEKLKERRENEFYF